MISIDSISANKLKKYLTLFIIICHQTTLKAQWSSDPSVNNIISNYSNHQLSPKISSDGSGGAIITWQDYRSGTTHDIYAQKISSTGYIQWASSGVLICDAAGTQSNPTIISDGSGGAIIAWQDERGSSANDIYAQRINSSGTVQWTANGVAISTATYNQLVPSIISDGSGGAIISWYDYRSGSAYDIYSQRINSSGTVQWTSNGVAICTASDSQYLPKMISDGSSGAIITWHDYRSGSGYDIYAQRINSGGTVQWTSDGVVITNASQTQQDPDITSDGSGGAIITWNDYVSSNLFDIYAQRINSSGAAQWTANGVAICSAADQQRFPKITTDGSNGAIITWYDLRGGSTNDIYAQRINSSGTVQWTTDGVAICTSSNQQYAPAIINTSGGGAIITWYDLRGGSSNDIYAQLINSSGTVQWASNGVAISTASNEQRFPAIIDDGSNGAIIAWEDYRNSNNDIFAAKINSSGVLPCKIISFNPICDKDKIELVWVTASELNNDYFTIEKANESLVFNEIVKIKGSGNSNQIINYSFIDPSPNIGKSYYRLKQTDYNGDSEYFNIAHAECFGNNILEIYPNPSSGWVTINTKIDSDFFLINDLGQKCLQVKLYKGNNNAINLEKLKSGIYFLVEVKNNRNHKGISKQKIILTN